MTALSLREVGALRDFFNATSAHCLADAYSRLSQHDPAAPAVPDWRAMEFAFNRLFVGPCPPLAPPYASFYLDSEPRLMGPSTLEIRHFYEVFGLQSPAPNKMPDDHISLELDAFVRLSTAIQTGQSRRLEPLRDYLIDHLQRWVPGFVERALRAPDLPVGLVYVLRSLAAWVAELDPQPTR